MAIPAIKRQAEPRTFIRQRFAPADASFAEEAGIQLPLTSVTGQEAPIEPYIIVASPHAT